MYRYIPSQKWDEEYFEYFLMGYEYKKLKHSKGGKNIDITY